MLYNIAARYRIKPDKPDWRDLVFWPRDQSPTEAVDLRKYASTIENQQQLGSCTAQAVVGAYELLLNKQQPAAFVDLSRLFVYYNSREIDGTVNEDSGAYVRDAVKSLHQFGICAEITWPHDIQKFKVKPDQIAYNNAKLRNIKNYYRIIKFADILSAIQQSLPVTFGVEVFPTFEQVSAINPTMVMPAADEHSVGSHAMTFVGFDSINQVLITRNSFGKDWGIDGYCYMPYAYAEKFVSDAWVFDINLTPLN